jgi:hypothetical protein
MPSEKLCGLPPETFCRYSYEQKDLRSGIPQTLRIIFKQSYPILIWQWFFSHSFPLPGSTLYSSRGSNRRCLSGREYQGASLFCRFGINNCERDCAEFGNVQTHQRDLVLGNKGGWRALHFWFNFPKGTLKVSQTENPNSFFQIVSFTNTLGNILHKKQ